MGTGGEINKTITSQPLTQQLSPMLQTIGIANQIQRRPQKGLAAALGNMTIKSNLNNTSI